MRFLLGTLTLLVVIDCAVAVCSTFQTQINVSMCSWQGLRGKCPFIIFRQAFVLLTQVANILRDTVYLDGGRLWYQKYEAPHGQSQIFSNNCRGYDDGCVQPQPDNSRHDQVHVEIYT
jgi:hypothetical protein